jgi:aminoglycoside phosphotransferase (APT) family kinase protein
MLEGDGLTPRFIDPCLASPNFHHRASAELRGHIRAFAWSRATQFDGLDREASQVHGDFSRANVLIQRGRAHSQVAAVLDWEFAVSGSPLIDVGHFLRYERALRPRTSRISHKAVWRLEENCHRDGAGSPARPIWRLCARA